MKFDPGIHIAMHSVLSLKLGVTKYFIVEKTTQISRISALLRPGLQPSIVAVPLVRTGVSLRDDRHRRARGGCAPTCS